MLSFIKSKGLYDESKKYPKKYQDFCVDEILENYQDRQLRSGGTPLSLENLDEVMTHYTIYSLTSDEFTNDPFHFICNFYNTTSKSLIKISHFGKGTSLITEGVRTSNYSYSDSCKTIHINSGRLDKNTTREMIYETGLRWWFEQDVTKDSDQFPASCTGSVYCMVGMHSAEFRETIKNVLGESRLNKSQTMYDYHKMIVN